MVNSLDKRLDGVDGRTPTAEIRANIDQAQTAIRSIMRSLSNIPLFKNININTKRTSSGDDAGNAARGRADGGPITGIGGPKQDNIPIDASVGEHMWTAREVENASGHGAMYAMRAQARAGKRPTYAVGGAIEDAWDQAYRAAAAAFPAYSPPSVQAAPSAAPAGPSTVSASLKGARARMTKDGFAEFVDGRIEVAISQNKAYRGKRN